MALKTSFLALLGLLDAVDQRVRRAGRLAAPYIPHWYSVRGMQWYCGLNILGDLFIMASGGFAAESNLEGICRAVAAFGGILAHITGLLMKVGDMAETATETEAFARMPPLSYVLERIRQVGQPFTHWRQTLGLSVTGFGMAYLMAGVVSGRYSEMASGVFLASGALFLMLEKDTATAWRGMGTWCLVTLMPLGFSHAAEALLYHHDPYVLVASLCWMMGTLTAITVFGREQVQPA